MANYGTIIPREERKSEETRRLLSDTLRTAHETEEIGLHFSSYVESKKSLTLLNRR